MASRRKLSICVWALALAVISFGMSADGTRFDRLGHQMMCSCGCNQILLDCNHVGCPSSDGMRKELAASIARGDSAKQTFDWFVTKYGPIVLAAPTTTGFDRVAWIMPYALFFGSIAFTMLIIQT